MASDEAWRAAHLETGRLVTWAGICCAVVGAALLFRPFELGRGRHRPGGMVAVLTLVVVGGARGHRAARDVLGSEEASD